MSTNLETEKVYNVYNIISKHFSTTRKVIWPKVQEFIDSFDSNTYILDIGCGNSKNMGTRDDCKYVGLDFCENLIKQTKIQSNCSYVIGNCIELPFQTNTFDYAMSIAVIHHLSTTDRRLKALEEMIRILKTNGKALIYVWAFEQPRFSKETTQDVEVKWMLQKKYSSNNQQDQIFNRYYHLFKKNELEILLNNFKNITILESGNQYNNCYCLIKKN